MRNFLFLALLGCFGTAHAASTESCGIQATKLLAAGDLTAAARLFKAPTSESNLKEILDRLGDVTDVRPVAKRRFYGLHHQISVSLDIENIPYPVDFVDAESSKLGPVQFDFATPQLLQGQPCLIMAIRVNFEPSGERR